MKKLLPYIIIILVASLGIVVAVSINKEEVPTSTNNIQENKEKNEAVVENTIDNTKEDVNEIQEPSEDIQNEMQNETENTVEESGEKDVEKTDEEKAVDLAKKEWGNDSSVSFVCTGKNAEGKYIVRVSQGSRNLEWYIVDLQNGTCEPR